MNRAILGSLTERHLMLFGTVIQLFARYELVIQEIMTTVSGADPAAIMLLTRGLDFREKRRALLDLLYHWTIPVDQYDRIGAFLLVPDELTPLHGDITHAAWVSDQTSSWIQPDWILRSAASIKPVRDAPLVGGARFIERNDNKTTYTVQGLEDIVNSLASNYELFTEYLQGVKLIGANGRPTVNQR